MNCDSCNKEEAVYLIKGTMKASDMRFGLAYDKLIWEQEGLEVKVCEACTSKLHPALQVTEKICLTAKVAVVVEAKSISSEVNLADIPDRALWDAMKRIDAELQRRNYSGVENL